MPKTMPLYPLLFEPIYKEKVWGGRALERLGRRLPGDRTTPIGESWELVDLASTSVSGGGGGAERSVVAGGVLAGTRIDELATGYPRQVTGGDHTSPAAFPLLIKYLDAHSNLSVQVHPSPAYAAAHPDAHLKSEAWYIVDCKPDAVIYKGLRPGVTAGQFRAALETNTDAAVLPLLNTVPVQPGDCHYLPSGTCHALGAGVLVAEVQTPSDTTFRVYDWGRTGRELHIDPALECIAFPAPDSPSVNAFESRDTRRNTTETSTTLVRCPFFGIERVEAQAGHRAAVQPDRPEVWMVLSGRAELTHAQAGPTPLTPGQTLLLPAGLGAVELSVLEDAGWLRITIPTE